VLGDVPWWLAALLAATLAFVRRPTVLAAQPEPALGPAQNERDPASVFRQKARRWLLRLGEDRRTE
jgi:hypothetical protein